MNKQDLITQGIMTIEEMQEYEELLILEKFYILINEQIDIGSEDIEPEPKISKGYYFDKSKGKYRVRFLVDGSFKSFGSYDTESEAKERVNEIRDSLPLL